MHLFVGTVLAAVILAVPCEADEMFQKYGSTAGWDIFVNPSMGPGCLIAKQNTAAGTQAEIGIDASGELRGYLALYTKRPANVTAGEKVPVVFDVDGQRFTGVATGQEMAGFDGAVVPINNLDFIYGLAKKHTLTIYPTGRDPIVLSLDGTDAAFKSLRECQAAQKK
ncbi:hypothetical protein [Rhizobium sp. RAF56]|jgi:hypothetical protein|uniref:hypothetical protein n=1 Tax=Rhizobium sp. RAF56 TaxID=3233062 RepID=UPI003F9AD10D